MTPPIHVQPGPPGPPPPVVEATEERVAALAEALTDALGSPETWPDVPGGYPDSLALCLLDAWYSTGHGGAEESSAAAVQCYRVLRGADAERDGAHELVAAIQALGGDLGWAREVGAGLVEPTEQDRSRAEIVRAAAHLLTQWQVRTAAQFRDRGPDRSLYRGWVATLGQGHLGADHAWGRAHLLAGTARPFPGRKVRRFVADAIGMDPRRTPPDVDLSDLLAATAAALGRSAAQVRHAIGT